MKTKWLQRSAALLALLAIGLHARADDSVSWQTFTDPENRFSILMPGKPEQQDETKPGYASHTYMAKENTNLYLAGVTLYDPSIYNPSAKPEGIEAELAADRDNFNKAVNAHGSSGQRRKFDGYPALEFTSASSQANFSGLIILAGSHCYMVVAAYHTPDKPAEATRFFQSYKLLAP